MTLPIVVLFGYVMFLLFSA